MRRSVKEIDTGAQRRQPPTKPRAPRASARSPRTPRTPPGTAARAVAWGGVAGREPEADAPAPPRARYAPPGRPAPAKCARAPARAALGATEASAAPVADPQTHAAPTPRGELARGAEAGDGKRPARAKRAHDRPRASRGPPQPTPISVNQCAFGTTCVTLCALPAVGWHPANPVGNPAALLHMPPLASVERRRARRRRRPGRRRWRPLSDALGRSERVRALSRGRGRVRREPLEQSGFAGRHGTPASRSHPATCSEHVDGGTR